MLDLGIDVGGTFIKGALLSGGKVVGEVVRSPMPPFLDPTSPRCLIDPDSLMESVHSVISAVIDGQSINRIFVTGQMASIAFTDERGKAVSPIISWQDPESGSVERVQHSISPEALLRTGDGIRESLPLVRLSAMKIPVTVHVTSLLAYVAGALIGSRVRLIHTTDAAAWGMLNLTTGNWDSEILDFLCLTRDSLPHVTGNIEQIGTQPRTRATVFVAVGDQQASLLGAGFGSTMQRNCASVNLATGGQVSVVEEGMASRAQLRPFFAGRWLHTVTHLPAGRLLAAAVCEETGGLSQDHWKIASGLNLADGPIHDALAAITDGVVQSLTRVAPGVSCVRYSGGLIQRFPPLAERLDREISGSTSTFWGQDPSLAGLGLLAQAPSNH